MPDGAHPPAADKTGAILLREAETYTRNARFSFGYVEDRPVSVRPYPNALVTAQRHVSATEYVGAVYDAERRLVASSQRFNKGDLVPIDPATVDTERVDVARRIPRAVYGGMIFTVLGHFLFETAARLWPQVDLGGRRAPDAERLRFIFHPAWGFKLRRFMDTPLLGQAAAALGVRPDNLILATEDLRVDMLYYAEPISIYHEYIHPMMNRVLDHMVSDLSRPRSLWVGLTGRGAPARRVFLSRSRWPLHVRVTNEAELENVFRERGFAVVHPQDLSPAEVIRLMQGAEIVAATDGSHAHLAAFCRPGTRTLLVDTRLVPTQIAIETLRGLDGLHLPAFANPCGVWDESAKRIAPEPLAAFADAALNRP